MFLYVSIGGKLYILRSVEKSLESELVSKAHLYLIYLFSTIALCFECMSVYKSCHSSARFKKEQWIIQCIRKLEEWCSIFRMLNPGFTTENAEKLRNEMSWFSFLNLCSVKSRSHVQLFVTPWTAARQTSLSITNSWSLPKLMSIDSVMPSICHPLLLPPSIFSSIRVFSNESALRIRWPMYSSLNLNISPSNEHPGLISFRMDWLDLLVVQGTLKSLLQYHSSKASFLRCSAFFIVQLSHPYMTTGKTTALNRWTFVGKVISLFLICFLSGS